MSTGRSSTSNQDGLLALVGANHPPSQQMRSFDDDESLILCSLAKSRPACRRRGCDSVSSQEATRLSVSSAPLEPYIVEEEEGDDPEEAEAEEEEEEVAEEEEDDELHLISSPVIDVIEQIEQVPYDEITESFRKDINQMMRYDALVNSMAKQQRPTAESAQPMRQQRPTTVPTSPKSGTTRRSNLSVTTESPFRYTSTTISRVTEKDMEKLREFVRMDRGLPLTKKERRKLVEFKKEPAVRPKMNRATAIRTQHIRKCSLAWSSKSSFDDVNESIRTREEARMKRVKQLAARERVASDQPLYKYNRGFEMRYQANKGNPIMPSSFRDAYEAYNKPLFSMPRTLTLPRRYLWPEQRKNHISYLGFRIEEEVAAPPQYQESKIVKQKKTRKLARPPVRKTQRVLRLKPTPQPKSKKTPWNYGVFERANKRLQHH